LSLTPPNSCDNLGLGRDPSIWVAENRNFFTFRTVLVSEYRRRDSKVIVAVVDSPRALPEENND
jgi:hypothetical protein